MTSAKCFLGCTNVRYGARIVSILDFWIGVILLIKCLMLLNPFYEDYYYYSSRTEQIIYDLIIFSYLFLISVFLNVNYYLKESTYDHKVHKIYHWLAVNTIFLSFLILAITYITIKNYCPVILYYSVPVCIIHLCQIYVVKSFYDDELLATQRPLPTPSSDVAGQSQPSAAVSQNLSQNSVNVTLSRPPAPIPVYPVQSAPQQEAGWQHSGNGAALPVPVASHVYPQLHHGHPGHNGAEPHFQTSVSLQPGPSSVEVQQTQEYYNPPAYSLPYKQQAEIHSVRKI